MLNPEQLKYFDEFGFLILPELLSSKIVSAMAQRADALAVQAGPGNIVEEGGQPCSIYVNFDDPVFENIMRHNKLVAAAAQLLRDQVYIHQCKVNHKVALVGSEVMWHRDFTYWHVFDGMPNDQALTLAIALDEINDFNSPLLLVESSHQSSISAALNDHDIASSNTGVETSWLNTQTKNNATQVGQLRYTIDQDELLQHTSRGKKIVSFKGKAGSVVLFHSNLIHGSTKNISPWDRRMVFITYNAVSNKLKPVNKPRADFIANQNFDAIYYDLTSLEEL